MVSICIILVSSSTLTLSANVLFPVISFSCDDRELSSLDESVISVIKDSDRFSSKCNKKEEEEEGEGEREEATSVDDEDDDVMQSREGSITSIASSLLSFSPVNTSSFSFARKVLLTLESSFISSRSDKSSALLTSSCTGYDTTTVSSLPPLRFIVLVSGFNIFMRGMLFPNSLATTGKGSDSTTEYSCNCYRNLRSYM